MAKNLEFCKGSLIPGVTSLCRFVASDLPLCAGYTWLHLTESAVCHRAVSQARQCDVGSLITGSCPYLPVPFYIFHITPMVRQLFVEPDCLELTFLRPI